MADLLALKALAENPDFIDRVTAASWNHCRNRLTDTTDSHVKKAATAILDGKPRPRIINAAAVLMQDEETTDEAEIQIKVGQIMDILQGLGG